MANSVSLSKSRPSGSAQRKRALAKSAPLYFQDLKSPPLAQGVDACLSWANEVGLRVYLLVASEKEAELKRAKLLIRMVSRIGMLRSKAFRSEQAVLVRKEQEQHPIDLLSDAPPLRDPLATTAWAYFALVKLLFEACQNTITPTQFSFWEARSQVLVRLGYVKEVAETEALLQRLEEKQKEIWLF